jgi:hypothetical protein
VLVLEDEDVVDALLVEELSLLDSFFVAAPLVEPLPVDEPARLSVR